MNISKIKALWSLMTGGWAGLITYILDVVNTFLSTLDKTKLAQAAEIVKNVGAALTALIPLLPEKHRKAAKLTLEAINKLAESLKDGQLSDQELNDEIDAIEAAIAAWKESV